MAQGLAYSRLYNILKSKILNGEYSSGQKLPTEKEICETYEVSRITCRHALRLLQDEGFVDRSPGKGTFVRTVQTKKVPILNYDYIRSIQHEAPETTRKLLTNRKGNPPEDIADILGIFKNEECLILERLDLLYDEPIAYDRGYIPSNLTNNLTEEMMVRVDFLEVWVEKEGINLSHFRETIEAMEAGQEAKEKLRVTIGSALLKATDVIFNTDGERIAIFETYYRGDRFKLVSTKIRGDEYEEISDK
jgi:GntR family transcriptional regulator